MNEERLQEQAELYALIQNETRRRLLTFIYQETRSYKDLIDFSGLKPGSLYHHLKVMDKLVEKLDHGQYGITEQGRWIVSELDMVDDTKPQVSVHDKEKPTKVETVEVVEEELPVTVIGDHKPSRPSDKFNQIMWLGTPNIILVVMIISITILMGFQGVAIAGIAIYAAPAAGVFSVLAFVLGFLAIAYVERLVFVLNVHRSLQYAAITRLMGMLPASVVAMIMYLLFLLGYTPASGAWMVLFVVSSVLGYVVMMLGLQFLQGISSQNSAALAAIPAAIDLLIGLTILLISI